MVYSSQKAKFYTQSNIKVNKVSGHDKTTPSILKEVKHEISKPLSNLFNSIFNIW